MPILAATQEDARLKAKQYLTECCGICGLELYEIGPYPVTGKPSYRFRALIGHPTLAFIGVVWWVADPVTGKESFDLEIVIEPEGGLTVPFQLKGKVDNYQGRGPANINVTKIRGEDGTVILADIKAAFSLVKKILSENKLVYKFSDWIDMFAAPPNLNPMFDWLAQDEIWGTERTWMYYEAQAALKFKCLLHPNQAKEYELAIASVP